MRFSVCLGLCLSLCWRTRATLRCSSSAWAAGEVVIDRIVVKSTHGVTSPRKCVVVPCCLYYTPQLHSIAQYPPFFDRVAGVGFYIRGFAELLIRLSQKQEAFPEPTHSVRHAVPASHHPSAGAQHTSTRTRPKSAKGGKRNTSLREWRPFCPVTPRLAALPLPVPFCSPVRGCSSGRQAIAH